MKKQNQHGSGHAHQGGQTSGTSHQHAGSQQGSSNFDAAAMLERMDEDGDGSVTLSDMLSKVLDNADERFAHLDSDDDAAISLEEFTSGRGHGRGHHQDDSLTREALFAAMDSNADDVVDSDEYQAYLSAQAEERFAAMDTDSDGIISQDEITAHHDALHADSDSEDDTTSEDSDSSGDSDSSDDSDDSSTDDSTDDSDDASADDDSDSSDINLDEQTAIVSGNALADYLDNQTIVASYVSGSDAIDDAEEFNIQLDFIGEGWTEALMSGVENAADFLSALITSDIAPDGADDISIDISLEDIDGSGGTVAQTTSTYVWTDSSLPSQAEIEVDVADAESYEPSGLWGTVLVHEMIHAIGFGSVWGLMGLVETEVDDNETLNPFDDLINYIYLGANAAANDTSGNDTPVLETDGGVGTAYSHWDEEVYGNELMTGYIGEDSYLSDMTLGALEDLGYAVDYSVNYADFMIV